MSSGTTATLPAEASPPSSNKVRLPLHSIQGLVAAGRVRLSRTEIQLFRQRGILRSETASQALEAISETAVASPQSPRPGSFPRAHSPTRSSPDQTSRSPSVPAASSGTASPPYTFSTAASIQRGTPSPRQEFASCRRQSQPTYHYDLIEDTCSHLHTATPSLQKTALTASMDISTSYRRHSESSMAAHPVVHSACQEPVDGSLVVPSPRGMRTVLYAASPAHTLYSLPRTVLDSTLSGPLQRQSGTMNAFRFPASSTPPPSQHVETIASSPLISSSVGFSGICPSGASNRSKRKGLAMRSPSISDSQDRSPGVIFQLPFGIQSANRSPPAVYPSPASSSTRSAATSNAGVELSGSERRPPPEPTLTHGLGIHVQAVFSEERVPHPFDTERISQGTDETVQTREVKHDLRMPTSQSDNLHGGFKDTLSPAMIEDRISAEISRAGCPSAGLSYGDRIDRTSAETILSSKTDPDTLTVSESKNTNAQEPATMPLWAQRQLNIRRQSLIPRPELDFVSGSGILPPANKDLILPEGGATILMYPVLLSDIVKVAQDDYQDRPHGDQNDEEDVLSGSTKSNKRRKTSCTGKKRDSVSGPLEAQPYEIEARFNRTNDVTDNEGLRRPPPMQAVSLPEAKGAYLNMIRGTLDSPPSPMATMSPQSRYPARRQSALGSPVEISTLSTFAAGANPRHGSRSAIRHESLEDLSWEEDDYRSSHSQVDPLESNSAEPKKDHQKKGGAKGREQRLATATSPKSGVRKKSLHLAGPMQSTMDVDQNKSKRDERGSKSPQKRPLREEYGETPHTPLSKKSKKASAPQSYHSGQLATPQSDRHSLASSGLNEEFELASTLINMHDGMILDTHSVSHLSHDHNTPKVKKSRAPKPCLPNPAKASNGSHKKPTVMSMSKIHKTATPGQKHCEACGATETPCWRPGYTSSTVLCNSCGLRYKKANVYCTKPSCKYIPLKTEYAAMETERAKNGWNHLRCKECGERVELPVLKD